ncbi:hypothetical protein IY974_05565 [Campylobacter volucris]|uniref:phosphopantetheine-binding protein n=1 Tax=Campylobacter volucris TaxID=1031542 RepID=UPI00189FEB4A|nr:phosphopantetheine-binding protein [Campylobacter volucris]MBF7046026.1 hypothetical protein [Campylobacter volucris]
MKMTTQNFLDIIENIGVLVDIKTLDHKQPLKNQGIDSLDMANIFLNLQEKYNIEISMDDAKKLNSIEDFINFINTIK